MLINAKTQTQVTPTLTHRIKCHYFFFSFLTQSCINILLDNKTWGRLADSPHLENLKSIFFLSPLISLLKRNKDMFKEEKRKAEEQRNRCQLSLALIVYPCLSIGDVTSALLLIAVCLLLPQLWLHL